MTERDAFAAVCAAPDDDAPRLAYADIVQQSEPEYAEFIRLQVARSADERTRKVPQGTMSKREYELWHKNYAKWGHYIQRYCRDARDPWEYDQGWGFDRGFVAFVRMEPENFVALGERLFRMAPVQHADLYYGQEPVRPLFDSPFLAKLDSLSLWASTPKLTDDDAIAIANCAALARSTWLDLRNNDIADRGIEALATSPYMANKLYLDTRFNPGDPSEQVSYDSRGTVSWRELPQHAMELELKLGRKIGWFRSVNDPKGPDRYHAKWFTP